MRGITRTHGNLLKEFPKLGPGITAPVPPSEQTPGPPFDIDVDDENLNSKYVLSKQQREIISDQKTIQRSDQNDNILSKRDRLPDRFQQLISDVALLATSPYFSPEQWDQGPVDRKGVESKWAELNRTLEDSDVSSIADTEDAEDTEIDYYETTFSGPDELWNELIDVDHRSQQVRDDVFFTGNSVASSEVQFGYEVGSLLQMLRPSDETDEAGIDLIWGFVLGLIGQSKVDIDKERELLENVISEMSDRHESRREESDLILDLHETIEQGTEVFQMTAEAVEEEGFEPHPIIVEEVLYHQTEFEQEENLHKGNAKQTLSEIEDVVPLRLADDLYKRLAADVPTIIDEEVQEIDSIPSVIEAFQASTPGEDDSDSERPRFGSKSTGEIFENVEGRKTAVKAALNQLSAERSNELWTTTPVVEKKRNGNWRLTSYGILLHHILKNHQGDPSAVYHFALGPEDISLQTRKLILEVFDEENTLASSSS